MTSGHYSPWHVELAVGRELEQREENVSGLDERFPDREAAAHEVDGCATVDVGLELFVGDKVGKRRALTKNIKLDDFGSRSTGQQNQLTDSLEDGVVLDAETLRYGLLARLVLGVRVDILAKLGANQTEQDDRDVLLAPDAVQVRLRVGRVRAEVLGML